MYSLDFLPSGCDFRNAFWGEHMPQILTANTLNRGEVVYFSAEHGWVHALEEAEVLADENAKDALKAAGEWVRRREIVNPYLFAVRVEGGQVTPVKAREVIRAAGPTIRRDLGKQAGGN
jgi:hypothetical protein